MKEAQSIQCTTHSIEDLGLEELRQQWTQEWGVKPHHRIGRTMLEKSLAFKMRESQGHGLTPDQRKRLDQLVSAYKSNPKLFNEGLSKLKPGIRLVKHYRGTHHSVLVCDDGFEYRGKHYGSLSEIASLIAGTRWNGWTFFGIKRWAPIHEN